MPRRYAWVLDLVLMGVGGLLAAFTVEAAFDDLLEPPFEFAVWHANIPEPHVTLSAEALRQVLAIERRTAPTGLASALLRLRLLGTTVARTPAWSMALLDDGSGARPALVGEAVAGGTLTEIGDGFAVLRFGQLRERLAPTNEVPAPVAADLAGLAPTALSRAEVARLLANPAPLLSAARFVPPAGGFRALDVVPGGLFARLGVRSGDVIRSIDGLDASNPLILVQSLPALLARPSVDVEVLRGGASARLNVALGN